MFCATLALPAAWLRFCVRSCVHFCAACLCLAGALWPACASAGRLDTPATLVLTGRILPSAHAPGLRPGADSRVLLFSSVDGQLIGAGEVSGDGTYVLAASQLTRFNGTAVVLEIQLGRTRHALLPPAGGPAWFAFHGQTLPERQRQDWLIGPRTAELSADEALTPQAQRLNQQTNAPCTPAHDANGDGQCDEKDWAILRLYNGGISFSSP